MKKYISQFLALALSVMVIPALPVYISKGGEENCCVGKKGSSGNFRFR